MKKTIDPHRVLVAASTYTHIERFHTPYIAEMKKRGYTVETVAAGEGADYNVPFEKKIFSLRNFGNVFRIRKIVKKGGYGTVFTHTSLAAFVCRAALLTIAKRNRPYVVNTVHGYLFDEHSSGIKRRIYLLAERMMRRATDEIAVMNACDRKITAEHKLAKGKISLIPGMGVDFSRIRTPDDAELSALREKLHIAESDYVLCYVGEISKRKNQMTTVEAVEELRNEYPVKLILVGTGDQQEKIADYATQRQFGHAVIFPGEDRDVGKYLALADAYVSASRIEGMPFNLLEAMYASLPVVASDCKGQNDLIENGKDGLLYPVDDREGMKRAIVSLIKNEIDAKALGKAAHETALRYAIENVFPETLQLYLDAIERT